jgi:hypothetical protein
MYCVPAIKRLGDFYSIFNSTGNYLYSPFRLSNSVRFLLCTFLGCGGMWWLVGRCCLMRQSIWNIVSSLRIVFLRIRHRASLLLLVYEKLLCRLFISFHCVTVCKGKFFFKLVTCQCSHETWRCHKYINERFTVLCPSVVARNMRPFEELIRCFSWKGRSPMIGRGCWWWRGSLATTSSSL